MKPATDDKTQPIITAPLAADAAGLAASFRELAAQYRQAGDDPSGVAGYVASQRREYAAAELCRWLIEMKLLTVLPIISELAAFHYGEDKPEHPGERYRNPNSDHEQKAVHWLLRPLAWARCDNNFWADVQSVLQEENPTRFAGNRAFETARAVAIANPTDAAACRDLEQRWASEQAATCCRILAERLELADDASKPKPAAAPVEPAKRTHSDDFTMVKWDETEYTFSPGLQAGAMKALWRAFETTGLGLHQETIRESIDAERDHFRLSNVFRDHPAYGVIIQSCGEGIYRLGKPDAKAQSPKRKARTAKTVKPAKPAKSNGYNERTLRAKRKIEADFPDEAADD